jgi:RNA polymerase sigma-70 factor (ECF subfamily)
MRLVSHLDAAGDGATEALVHLDALHRLARHLTGRGSDAEDLVQETFARALRGAARFTPGTDLRAWLFRILRNAFLDGWRREARGPIDPDAAPADGAGAPAGEAWLRGDAELEALRRVVGAELEAALAELPEAWRTVVLLDQEGLDDAEIAEVVACAPGTVKSRLSRARAALRARLAEYRR